MKLINKTVLLMTLGLLITTSSCQDKYPDLEDGLYAEFVTTKGTMVAKLEYEKVPVTVANFVALAEGNHPLVKEEYKGKKYYNGITFHRVMDGFMIQGGDPTATGSGDPGYRFEDEFDPDLIHDRPGILSMANSGPGTNGSQFFITEVPTPWLDNKHAVFGELVIGLDVQDSISNVQTSKPDNKPLKDVVINELNIIRKGLSTKSFDAPKVFTEGLPKLAERQRIMKEEARKKVEEKAAIAREKFLKDNENLKGRVENFQTGISMIYTKESQGVKPKSTDNVLINCAGYFTNGDLFYTTWKEIAQKYGKYNEQMDQQGMYKPFPMIYNETATLVPGFREAMLNMNVGDMARVYIPSYLGYGERGYGPVPPNTDLIFDIEIDGIQN